MERLKIGVPKEQGLQEKEKYYSWPHCCEQENTKRISKEELWASLEKEDGMLICAIFFVTEFIFLPLTQNQTQQRKA